MIVRAKVGLCQVEWYRDNKKLLPPQIIIWGVFFCDGEVLTFLYHKKFTGYSNQS